MLKTIVMYSGPSYEKWDYQSCENGGIGGSETNQIKLSEEFAKLGFRVICFNDCATEGKFNNVTWLCYSKFPEFIKYNYIDYFISERTTSPLSLPIRAGKKFVLLHDIWLSRNREVPFAEKVDQFLCLSPWHREFVSKHHILPLEKISIVSNGINLTRYQNEDVTRPYRRQYRLIWSSSLDRGLDCLLEIFDFVKKEISELELHIFYGMDNWEKSVLFKPQEKQKIEFIKNAMKRNGVYYHGRVGQDELAIEQMRSSLWVYPTNFTETWCITAVEMMAAGTPIICSNLAGLRTTVGDAGILIGNGNLNENFKDEFKKEFAKKIIDLLKNEKSWDYWSNKGLEKSKQYTWQNSAKHFVDNIFTLQF